MFTNNTTKQNNKTIKFIEVVSKYFPNYDYSMVEYINSKSPIKIKCNKCGNIFMRTPEEITYYGRGCRVCKDKVNIKNIGILKNSKSLEYSKSIDTNEFMLRLKTNLPKDKFDNFSFEKTLYHKMKDKIIVHCKKHNLDFSVIACNLLNNKSDCPKCYSERCSNTHKIDTKTFIQKSIKKHYKSDGSPKYNYDKTIYNGSNQKVIITCLKHGDFEQLPSNHLSGSGCPKCYYENILLKNKYGKKYTTDMFIIRCKFIHKNSDGSPKYNYDKTIFKHIELPVTITCSKHGDFVQTPAKHIIGQGCPKCANELLSAMLKMNQNEFILKSKKIHKNYDSSSKYNYDKTIYNGSNQKVIITCLKHGDFEQLPSNHLSGSGCPKCYSHISKGEQELYNYIKYELNIKNIIQSETKILNGVEIDIYIPENNLGIEFNGNYWHSELFRDKYYHLNKTINCEEKNIHLIHVMEHEWKNKKEIIKSRLKQYLNKTENKIYARNCKVIKIDDNSLERTFMETNHLQGYIKSEYCLGLVYDGKIVSMMSFGKIRFGRKNNDSEYELYRLCSKLNYNIIGGASKLFKYFIKNYLPTKIISYANRNYTYKFNNVYIKIGMKYTGITEPGYGYIIDNKYYSRYKMNKSELVKNWGCPQNMSESEFTKLNGWNRIYDSGNLCFVWEK